MMASTSPDSIPISTVDVEATEQPKTIPSVDVDTGPGQSSIAEFPRWLAITLGMLVFVLLGLIVRRVLASSLNNQEREEFAETLRTRLSGFEEVENVN